MANTDDHQHNMAGPSDTWKALLVAKALVSEGGSLVMDQSVHMGGTIIAVLVLLLPLRFPEANGFAHTVLIRNSGHIPNLKGGGNSWDQMKLLYL